MSVELRPRRLRKTCRWTAAAVLLVFGALAVLLPTRGSKDQPLGVVDQLSFFSIGLVLALAVLALSRPRVRADGSGIWVRNVLGDRFFPWQVVALVHLPEGSSWAQLELHDDEQVALLALQANDGNLAVTGVEALRALQRGADL